MGLCPDVLFKNLSKDFVDALGIDGYTLASLDIRGAENISVAHGISLAKSVLKKWEPLHGGDVLSARAVRTFLQCNSRCAEFKPQIDNPLHMRVLDEMAYTASQELTPITWYRLFHRGRHGPGASVLSNGKNSSFEKLFLNRLSTTSLGLYQAYLRCCRVHPVHHAAELRRVELRGSSAVRVVEGSTLSTVRKNDSTDRTICTEPSLNMFWQLAVGEELNFVLKKHYGYDPALQPDRNRALACLGSTGGGAATIDLSSASDTIAMQLVAYVMRSDWLAVIEDTRSPFTKVDGKYVRLEMVSSMGNGFTFPLQTYLFSLAIKCLCKHLGVQWQRYDSSRTLFGVFGDDIIIPDQLFEPVLSLLRSLGFVPNENKSFGLGSFRESCGSDWLSGHNVRGVYIRKLTSLEDRFSAINRLNMWSARSGILLRRTIRYLLPSGWQSYAIPTDEAIDAGVICPYPLRRRMYYRRRRPVITTVALIRYKDGRLKSWADNPFGYLLSSIVGAVRSGCISRRQRDVTYADEDVPITVVWCCARDLASYGVAPSTVSYWVESTCANLGLA